MGQFNFECCGTCGGNKEQFDWTTSVVIALPVGKNGAIVHIRGEYTSYGKFHIRVVNDDNTSTDKLNVGEYNSLGKVINAANLPEIGTMIIEEESDNLTAVYCFGLFYNNDSIGTRFCSSPSERVFMGITISELAILFPKEAKELVSKAKEAEAKEVEEAEEAEEATTTNIAAIEIGATLKHIKNGTVGLVTSKTDSRFGIDGGANNQHPSSWCAVDSTSSVAAENAAYNNAGKSETETIKDQMGLAMARSMGIPIVGSDGVTTESHDPEAQVGIGLHRRSHGGIAAGRRLRMKISNMGWSPQYECLSGKHGEHLLVANDPSEELQISMDSTSFGEMENERPPMNEQQNEPECTIM